MLIICKHLEHSIYNNIQNNIKNIYDIDTSYNDDIIMNAIPIKYNDEYYIFANLAKLEISAISYHKKSYNVEIIINDKQRHIINIANVISVHQINSKIIPNDGDCFYDEHLNIMFIKFRNIHIEYIDITLDNFTLERLEKLNNINIIFKWLNNLCENKIINSSENKLIFQDDFIDLPKIPVLSSNSQTIDELIDCDLINYPCTGASVFSETSDFIGMVSYSDKETIITIPVILLKRTLEYLDNKPICKNDLIVYPIQINYLDDPEINDFGLYYKKKSKKYDIHQNYNIITLIDGYIISPIGDLIINNLEFSLSTYLWLMTINDKLKLKSIKKSILKDTKIFKKRIDCNLKFMYFINLKKYKEEMTFINYEIKINKSLNKSLSVSNLNFINYNNKIMIELNEKIMQLLKPVMQTTDILDYLYDYVIEKNKYNEKIILIIDDRLNIKIVNNINDKKIKSITDVFKIFKTIKKVEHFIENFK
jgi:hypothetical protein